MPKPFRLLYISQLAEPDRYNATVHDQTPDGQTGGDWMRTRMRDLGLSDAVQMTDIDVCFGDEIPDHRDFNAVVIGGSVHSVLEMRPWHHRLLTWIAAYRPTGKPLLGICGGHQLMCQWQGQEVAKLRPEAFEATLTIELTDAGKIHPLFEGLDETVGYNFGNNEYVVGVPAGAEVLATLKQAQSLALDHGGNWYSIQFHPEISMETMQQYWQQEDPSKIANYRPTPEAPKLLGNFLKLAGLT
jgi:GMP synthase-like glutamine amidotransferase